MFGLIYMIIHRYKNLNRNSIRVMIVTPTRELANQVYSIATKLIKVEMMIE